jgi:hypothetical protein
MRDEMAHTKLFPQRCRRVRQGTQRVRQTLGSGAKATSPPCYHALRHSDIDLTEA